MASFNYNVYTICLRTSDWGVVYKPLTTLTTRIKKDIPVSGIADTTNETEARPKTLGAHPTSKRGTHHGVHTTLCVTESEIEMKFGTGKPTQPIHRHTFSTTDTCIADCTL